VWNDLTDEEKGWFKQAAHAGVEAERARIDKEQAEGLKLMQERGLQVVDDVDVEAFRKVLEPLYGTYYEKQFGKNLIERIRAVQ
jgi:TRAP-type C4-dicarboxylate transport system substrate-binding protein